MSALTTSPAETNISEMKVLAVCGSIRAKGANAEKVEDLARSKGDMAAFIARGRELTSAKPLSNSEILAAAAMKGALQLGAQVEYLPLIDLFEREEAPVFHLIPGAADTESMDYVDTLSISPQSLNFLKDKVLSADGIVMATPVYFGDRSSVANKLLQVGAMYGLLQSKVFGVASVGAKRNGGQETCNIYSIMEALNQGALAVGNGPPTSQYGGTAVGGNKSHVLDDEWGLTSSMGVGQKVAHVSSIMAAGADFKPDRPVQIDIVITNDTHGLFLAGYLHELAQEVTARMPWATINFHEVIHSTIFRCLGCNTCPTIEKDSGYARCRIKDPEDYVESLRHSLQTSDGVIIAGLNHTNPQDLIFRYQVLTERLRYIRRNNFEMTDLLLAGLCYHQFGATVNSIHSTKVLTSYIRHNTTFHRPIEIFEHQGRLLESGKSTLEDYVRAAQQIKTGRSVTPEPEREYQTGGIAGGYISN